MANALGIAAVTAVLKDLLDNGLVDATLLEDQEVTVSALPPDQVALAESSLGVMGQLNLFLYQVMPNLGWRNAQYPSHNSQGQRVANPPLALDLFYLLTAYSKAEFNAEILLGYAMQLLHEHPVFSKADIRKTFSTNALSNDVLPSRFKALSAAALAEQVESIKVTPHPLNTEEMSRIWSSLQASYRMSTVYQVSVVLIESQKSTKVALPIRQRNVFVTPLQSPFIREVGPQMVAAGERIKLRGSNLRGQVTQVRFGNPDVLPVNLPAGDGLFSAEALEVDVPDDLRAGTNTLQVVHQYDLGTRALAADGLTSEPHEGVASNIAAFVVRPVIDLTDSGGNSGTARVERLGNESAITAKASTLDPSNPDYRLSQAIQAPALWIQLKQAVWRNQSITLLLNQLEAAPEKTAQAYSISSVTLILDSSSELDLPVELQKSRELLFPVSSRLPAGEYLVRIRVDGADSALVATSNISGRFVSPKVTL